VGRCGKTSLIRSSGQPAVERSEKRLYIVVMNRVKEELAIKMVMVRDLMKSL
jgi:hypothetical protein